ncbi:unnamed protein product [Urochloa humidicola]
MPSPAVIVQGLIIVVILISLLLVFLACNTRNTRNNQDQHQQADADDMDEVVQMASIAMALLDRVTYPRHCQSSEEDCAICLGTFEDGDLCSIMPLCRHEFHRACIASWLMAYNNTCPLCRAQLQWLTVAQSMV